MVNRDPGRVSLVLIGRQRDLWRHLFGLASLHACGCRAREAHHAVVQPAPLTTLLS